MLFAMVADTCCENVSDLHESVQCEFVRSGKSGHWSMKDTGY